MKVLLVADAAACGVLDGPGPWLDELTRHLAGRGHRVHALVRAAGAERDDAPAAPASRPFTAPARSPTESLVAADRADEALAAALDADPDVVHVTTVTGWSEATAARLAHRPVLLDLWDFAALCPEGTLLRQPGASACALAWPAPECARCTRAPRPAAMPGAHRMVAAATRLVARSAWARDRLSRSLGRAVERFAFGVDTLRFAPEAPASARVPLVRGRTPRVLFAGSPTEPHGIARALDLLVALNARVPGVELVVAGRDPANPRGADALRTEAAELGLAAQLRWFPDATPDDLPPMIAACDLAVAPGLAPEPHGVAIVQAMAGARPVVAVAAGAALELIRPGEDGVLVPAGPVAPLADAVAALLHEPERRHALGEQARLGAMERHDRDPALFALEEGYHRLRRLRARPDEGRAAA